VTHSESWSVEKQQGREKEEEQEVLLLTEQHTAAYSEWLQLNY